MATLPTAATLTPKTSGPSTAGATSLAFHGWNGWISGLNTEIDRAHRVGQTGSVAQGIGKAADIIQIQAWKFTTSKADAIAFAVQCETLPSPTPYIILSPYGRTMNIRVIDSKVSVDAGRGVAVGSTACTHKVSVTLTIERQTDG